MPLGMYMMMSCSYFISGKIFFALGPAEPILLEHIDHWSVVRRALDVESDHKHALVDTLDGCTFVMVIGQYPLSSFADLDGFFDQLCTRDHEQGLPNAQS